MMGDAKALGVVQSYNRDWLGLSEIRVEGIGPWRWLLQPEQLYLADFVLLQQMSHVECNLLRQVVQTMLGLSPRELI